MTHFFGPSHIHFVSVARTAPSIKQHFTPLLITRYLCISFTLGNICGTAYLQFLQPVADTGWGRLAQWFMFCQEPELNMENVVSSTPVHPPGTLFLPTFTTLLTPVHSENDSRAYFLIVFTTDYCWRSWACHIAVPYKFPVELELKLEFMQSTTNLDNHFAASHVPLPLSSFLLSLVNDAVARRPIFQCKVTHCLAECAYFHVTCGRHRVAKILQKLSEPDAASNCTQNIKSLNWMHASK